MNARSAAHPLLAFFLGAAPVFLALLAMPTPSPEVEAEPTLVLPERPRWVAFVGGAEPSSTQVSLAQDARLWREVLGEDGALLFGGGSGSYVQVSEPREGTPTLRERLAELFAPSDREVRYGRSPLILC